MSIKTIDASVLRNNLGAALSSVNKDHALIVRKRGKDQAVIIDIDAYEDYLAAQDPEYLKSIAEARASKERYTPEEVFGELWNQA
jgi:prevent-host-death family protein